MKLMSYRNPQTVDIQLFTFDRNDPEMVKEILNHGVKVTEIGIYFGNPKAYLVGIPRLYKQIAEYKPHVIQTHHSPIVDWVARVVGKWSRVPVNVSRAVVMPRIYQTSRRKNVKGKLGWWFSRFGDWLTGALVDYYLPNSAIVKQYLQEEEKISPKRIIQINNGVDTDYFSPTEALKEQGRRLLSLSAEDWVISNVGLIKTEKGQFELVKAAANLMREFPAIKVAFVGKPQSPEDELYLKSMQKFIADRQLSHRFIFMGELHDVRPVLAVSNLYVHPSHLEGSPNALLEAMSMGCPCSVSSADGCREPVRGIADDFVFAVKDVAALEKSIRALWTNGELCDQLGMNLRKKIINQYSVYKMCAEVETVYRRGLADKGIQVIV
jgi:glycosyltransferase involved in cell wall biosynthesis